MRSTEHNTGYEPEWLKRTQQTLFAFWRALAAGSPGARVEPVAGAMAAIFPAIAVYNNAVIVNTDGLTDTLNALQRQYGAATPHPFAVWVSTTECNDLLVDAGWRRVEQTTIMAVELSARSFLTEMPLDLITDADMGLLHRIVLGDELHDRVEMTHPNAHVYACRWQGAPACCVMTFDHAGDCGVYSLVTVPAARRQGLATTLLHHALRAAQARGCDTASLQSTLMAESLYRRAGFHALGRYDEWVAATHDLA